MFNQYIEAITPSATIEVMAKVKKMRETDPEIIDLGVGEPDFDTPKKICDEMFKQVQAGYTHYTVGTGLPELRSGIAAKLKEENGCSYSPEGIIVTPGGKFSIYLAVRILLNVGDEVMYLTPGWVSYPSIITASGGVPVAVELKAAEQYKITMEQLEEKVSDKTRLLIINYPNNPTGCILSREEAEAIREFMLKHPDILLLSDEMYERIVYPPYKNISPASYPEIAERVITVNGFSKSAAMTGFRIGYMATTPKIAAMAAKLFSHTISCVSGFIQKAAVVALDCKKEMEEMRKQYERRRDILVNGLNGIPGVHCHLPEGAFYAWTEFDIPGMDSNQVCEFILENAKVVGIPGLAYGNEDSCHLRFCFAASEDKLEKAVKNIAEAMKKEK